MVSIKKINGISLIASKLDNSVNISLSGDITGTATFDGSENITISSNLRNTVTARNNLGLGNVSTLNTGNTNGTIPIVGTDNKLDSTIIPYPDTIEHHAYRHAANGPDEITPDIFMSIIVKSLNPTYGGTPLAPNMGGTGCSTYEELGDWIMGPLAYGLNPLFGGTPLAESFGGTGCSNQTELGPWMGGVFATNYGNNFRHAWKHALNSDDPLYPIQIGAVDLTDPRLTDTRIPKSHATTHMIDGSDVITPSDIGAATANHIHNVATISDAGFLPALSTSENIQILSGSGNWIDIPEIVTKINTVGATTGEMTKIGDHWGVAISSTSIVGAGVVSYGSDLTIGSNIYVNDSTGIVTYELPSSAGVYVNIGIVKSNNEISISEVQTKYTIIE